MTFSVSDKPADYVVCSQSHINKWPIFSLGELCRIVGGGTPSKKNPGFYSGDIPWVTVKDFGDTVIRDTIDHITEDAVERSATNIVPAGTVLVVTRVGLGKVAITGRDMAINQDIKALFPDERVLPEYLFWFLVSKSEEIERMGTGATVKGITLKQLKSLSVPLPSHTEQCRIVDILKRADSIRRLRKQAIDTARQIIPALFIDMFGDPVTNPKGLRMVLLGEISSEMRYGTSRKCTDKPCDDDLPVLRIPNIIGGEIDWNNLKYIKPHKDEKDKLSLNKGDLLFVRTNGNPDFIGRCAVFTSDKPSLFASYLIRVRLDPDAKCNPLYVKTALSMPSVRDLFFRQSKTTAGNFNINIQGLKSLRIPCADPDLQQAFIERLEDIKSILLQQEIALQKADQTFQSLLASIFGNPSASEAA